MNTTTRIGKIARLSHSIREQLNLKLLDGVPAKTILPWLNSLPEVKPILAADFDNRPINKQNLSEWKQGGHRDWLLLYHASHFLQFADSSSFSSSSSSSIPPTETQDGAAPPQNHPDKLTQHAIRNADHAPLNTTHNSDHSTFSSGPDRVGHHSALTSKLLLWTQLQYTTMARHIDAETDPERKWTALRQFANDISRLRRSTIADDFLQIQRDWLALSQSNTADKKEKDFWKWTKRPDIEKKLFPNRQLGMTAEQLYQFEKDTCLMDGPGPEIAELMAEVRIARKLLELRKAQEAEAKAKAAPDYDPNRPLPDTKVRLAGMPFEELIPTIPDKPLTETHPELDDDPDTDDSNGDSAPSPAAQGSAGRAATGEENAGRERQAQPGLPAPCPADNQPALRSAFDVGGSDSVKPSQTESNQINPTPPPVTPI